MSKWSRAMLATALAFPLLISSFLTFMVLTARYDDYVDEWGSRAFSVLTVTPVAAVALASYAVWTEYAGEGDDLMPFHQTAAPIRLRLRRVLQAMALINWIWACAQLGVVYAMDRGTWAFRSSVTVMIVLFIALSIASIVLQRRGRAIWIEFLGSKRRRSISRD